MSPHGSHTLLASDRASSPLFVARVLSAARVHGGTTWWTRQLGCSFSSGVATLTLSSTCLCIARRRPSTPSFKCALRRTTFRPLLHPPPAPPVMAGVPAVLGVPRVTADASAAHLLHSSATVPASDLQLHAHALCGMRSPWLCQWTSSSAPRHLQLQHQMNGRSNCSKLTHQTRRLRTTG